MTVYRWLFPHESLHVYHDAQEFLRRVHALSWPRGHCDLKRQLTRAAISIALNICEGRAQRFAGNSGTNFYRIALGSAAECHGALEVLQIVAATALDDEIQLLRRIGGRLSALTKASV
ncbi:MAG: four helix bundle protein [Planctomycetota bacterium]